MAFFNTYARYIALMLLNLAARNYDWAKRFRAMLAEYTKGLDKCLEERTEEKDREQRKDVTVS